MSLAGVPRVAGNARVIHRRECLRCSQRCQHRIDGVAARIAHHHSAVSVAYPYSFGDVAEYRMPRQAPAARERTAGGLLVVLMWEPESLERRGRTRLHKN